MAHEGHDHPHLPHGHHHEDVVSHHKAHAPVHVSTYVVTCSDSRDLAKDEGGALIRMLVEDAGHSLCGQAVIHDEAEAIRNELAQALELGARAVLFTGGTGISARDVTVETLTPLFEKTLPGFGELFRSLSFKEVGSAAMLSRACAGTYRGMVIFAVPGSPRAVRLALEALILPELGHAVRELSR